MSLFIMLATPLLSILYTALTFERRELHSPTTVRLNHFRGPIPITPSSFEGSSLAGLRTPRLELTSNSEVVEYDDFLPNPNTEYNATDVVEACMKTLLERRQDGAGLEVCFHFSTDRCRAALGGSLEKFKLYATNPVFGFLVQCSDYSILSVGPVIGATKTRGAMQTVLMEACNKKDTEETEKPETEEEPNSLTTSSSASEAKQRVSAAVAAVLKNRKVSLNRNIDDYDEDDDEELELVSESSAGKDNNRRRFLWTLQQERRPPRQGCWLVHEVIYVKNAFQMTL